MASNTVVQVDPAGNIKPAKNKSVEKIDGTVAEVMALAMAVSHEKDREPESPYAERGILTL